MRKEEEMFLLMVKKSDKPLSVKSPVSPLFLLSCFLFSCASFFFAADKQLWLIYERGCADANIPLHQEKDLIQT